MMEDLSYLTTEYARNKMVECRQLEERDGKYDGVQRWQRDPDLSNQLTTERREQIEKVMEKDQGNIPADRSLEKQ